ncbi:MAG: DUF4012 domain-containing protein [Sporichthyaceae bacterium]
MTIRRRRVLLVGTGAGLVLGAAWVGGTAFAARSELTAVRSAAGALQSQVRAGEFSAASDTADSLALHSRRAHRLTAGPAWWVAQRLPVIGDPLRTAAGLAATADEVASGAVPRLVAAGELLDSESLRGRDGRIDVATLRASAEELNAAAVSVGRATRLTDRLPRSTGVAAADRAREEVRRSLGDLRIALDRARTATRILPTMLGADRPRTYFVAFQNDAEARGTGGLPGAFAILRADRGRLAFERFESDQKLAGTAVDVALPAEFDRMYGQTPKALYLNSNLSPHFPYAAQIWAAMWQKKSGQRVDGALTVDPTALSYLLDVTGPVALPNGRRISAANVVSETQNAAYVRYGSDFVGRKRYLLDIARTTADRMVDFRGDPTDLVRGLARAATERRLLVWSADPAVQAHLAGTTVSGVVAESDAPYAGLSIVNSAGNKLDYYLDRSLHWQRTGCGPHRRVGVTIRLANGVPGSVATPYVVGRSDVRPYRVASGDHRVAVYYTATTGATLRAATVDGKPAFLAKGHERGRPVFVADVELPRGATRTLRIDLVEPGTAGPPTMHRQPLVRPLVTTFKDSECPN